MDRFWAKVDKSGPVSFNGEPCWTWTGAIQSGGYGSFKIGGKAFKAHRVAYELLVDEIPDGLKIDHLCHNADPSCSGASCQHRRCVNPAHMEPVTQRVNILRGKAGSAVNAVKTHCLRGHPFDEANTYVSVRGGRECRVCNREHVRIRMRAKRARDRARTVTGLEA